MHVHQTCFYLLDSFVACSHLERFCRHSQHNAATCLYLVTFCNTNFLFDCGQQHAATKRSIKTSSERQDTIGTTKCIGSLTGPAQRRMPFQARELPKRDNTTLALRKLYCPCSSILAVFSRSIQTCCSGPATCHRVAGFQRGI